MKNTGYPDPLTPSGGEEAEMHEAFEAESSVLRTRMMELGSRLQSLNEILHYLHPWNDVDNAAIDGFFCDSEMDREE
ncbi:bZIP transcription factor 11-like [Canna indica]|uniref:BZIP transcription factor 11-like n=1 Tax=Canna indica TaxID=4628 RepID=A0AAQ3L1D0_9LILI|nr:bZIP transcription factor 11-like [Canna indica]